MGVSEKAIRKLLRRLGWKAASPAQTQLPLDADASRKPIRAGSSLPRLFPWHSARCGPKPVRFLCGPGRRHVRAMDTDPGDRCADRLLARLGLLEDAPPLFGSATAVPRAGVLLALPVLVASGVFECAQKNLRQLWARPSMDCAPACSRSCSWRCGASNARKASRNTRPKTWGACWVGPGARSQDAAAQTGRAWPPPDAPPSSARLWPNNGSPRRGTALGFLYMDGHVRVYHGQHALPKTHVARMRISLPATSDYWVNDSAGDPLFVVTAEANAGLVKMLPGILARSARWWASDASRWSLIAAATVPSSFSKS